MGHVGVPKNVELAEKLIIYAYKLGDVDSISSIVDLYIAQCDYDRAMLWHERGIEKRSMFCCETDTL